MGRTIGITGGIGSGKSIVARVLRCNGFPVYDCDSEAKHIMNKNVAVKTSLKNRLGDDIYHKNGTLDRKKLSVLLFSNEEVRLYVNSLVHEAVRKDIAEKRNQIHGEFFIESAILATGGISPICDKIWVVTAPEPLRIERVKKRDKLSEQEIIGRIKTQERELALLDSNKEVWLENDDNHAMLSKILIMTNKFNHNQTYNISC